MPIELPAGYVTRSEAPKKYNRSQRALERDLDVALAIQDQELLSYWKLITKDGVVRDGRDVTLEIVKELVANGMAPAWCVAQSFLEAKYGRKGAPRPSALAQQPAESIPAESAKESQSPKLSRASNDSEPGETALLKRIIQNLEHEKEQERKRHDQIVAKLFQQLDVKDKQISAWDEVTQGLTKALATGQITPNIDHLLAGAGTKESVANDVGNTRVVDASPVTAVPEEGTGQAQKNPTRTTSKSVPAKRKSKTDKEQTPVGHDTKSQPKRDYFPTFRKLFSRRG